MGPECTGKGKEKWLKYADLATDLKTQYPQCAVVLVVPVVVGTLRVLGGLRRRLKQTKIFRDYQLDTGRLWGQLESLETIKEARARQ